jgi:hypothetical protein
MSFSLSSIFGSKKAPEAPAAVEPAKPKEVELTEVPAAPATTPVSAPVAEAAAQDAKTNFEWNVGRLYSDEGHSKARTWAVRILSTLLVFPLALTLVLDVARRLAFSVGLVDGKSYSLIDKASVGCQAVANKVSSVYQSFCKPLTKEELNAKSETAIKALSEKLVDGYKALNGGYFTTNTSFSSPSALNAERQIEKAKADLLAEVNTYVARNATGTEDFVGHLNVARRMVAAGIAEAAGNEPYIQSKVERNGPRPFLRDWARTEFLDALQGSRETIQQFVGLARQEPDFAAGLKRGVEAGILTEKLAKAALTAEVQHAYVQGLETGIEAADANTAKLLDSAVQNQVVSKEEATLVDESFSLDVDVLAGAAAKDVARKQTAATTEIEIEQQLTKAADGLKQKKKLKPQDETRFLTAAKAQLAKAREAVEAEAAKQKQEAEAIQAKQVAEVQKAADQSSLLGRFVGMLGIINKKQDELTAKFIQFGELEAKRQTVTDSLETIRTTEVNVRGVPMTILQAASEYYKAVSAISNSGLTPAAKKQQVKDLANQGFSQQTIDKINQLKALEPQLTEVLDQQEALAQAIDTQHEEIVTLIAKYKVFKKNNFGPLEKRNREVVVATEKRIDAVQKTLDQRHRQLTQVDQRLIDRLRPEPLRVVNMDPAANNAEVDALVDAFKKSQEPVAAEPEVISVPDALSYTGMAANGVKMAYRGITWPIRAPYNAIAERWNRPAAPAAATAAVTA